MTGARWWTRSRLGAGTSSRSISADTAAPTGPGTRRAAALDVDLAVNLARRLRRRAHRAWRQRVRPRSRHSSASARAVEEPTSRSPTRSSCSRPVRSDDADLRRLRGRGAGDADPVGAQEPRAADIERLRRASIGWTVGVTFAGDTGGTGLLAGPYASHVADKVSTFLREQAVLTGPGLARLRSS